jgi:hypothetical protein
LGIAVAAGRCKENRDWRKRDLLSYQPLREWIFERNEEKNVKNKICIESMNLFLLNLPYERGLRSLIMSNHSYFISIYTNKSQHFTWLFSTS